MSVDALRTAIDDLFQPVTAYTRALPADRHQRDYLATTTLPLDLAAAGFACRVERHGDGYALTITRPAAGAVPKLTGVGEGPTWLACCGEVLFDLHRRIDRIERDLERQREIAEREALAA